MMPKGTKRNHNGDPAAPTVGGKLIKKSNKIVAKQKAVAMLASQDDKVAKIKATNLVESNKLERRVSKRMIKAKRKIDFVYETESDTNNGENNNAQVYSQIQSKNEKSTRKSRVNDSSKVEKLPNSKQNPCNNFDGIQVSVISDEEELDYEDDIADQDDENGSINQETEVSSPNQEGANSQDTDENDIALGGTCNSLTEEQLIMNNPELNGLLNKMLDE